MVCAPLRSSARSRAGTTPRMPRRRRSRSSAARSGAERFATIDPEEFYDFQATRPRIKLVEGRARRDRVARGRAVRGARAARAARPDPALGQRAVVPLARLLPADRRAGRGDRRAAGGHARRAAGRRPPHPAGVGHRPRLRSGPRRAARPGSSSYEGPTGIVGVLHAACQDAGLPSASLWAAVPHYIAAAPNPKAALALVRKLEGLVGVAVDASELETAAADYERQVNLAVQSDPDVQAFVERLEQAAGNEDPDEPGRCRRATRSPATCSGSCASATTTPSSTVRPAPTAPRPGTRAGSRTSSTPRTTASARTPARGSPRRPPSPPRGSTRGRPRRRAR